MKWHTLSCVYVETGLALKLIEEPVSAIDWKSAIHVLAHTDGAVAAANRKNRYRYASVKEHDV